MVQAVSLDRDHTLASLALADLLMQQGSSMRRRPQIRKVPAALDEKTLRVRTMESAKYRSSRVGWTKREELSKCARVTRDDHCRGLQPILGWRWRGRLLDEAIASIKGDPLKPGLVDVDRT